MTGRTAQAASSLDPWIAVVIPAYRQPEYLQDAVLSAARQTLVRRTRIVIVNDGCPFPSTDWLGSYLKDAYPNSVYYLRKANGGLSSARNRGIRFALAAWPSVRAVFPLDADNRLSPTTLETLWRAIASSPEEVGWIYQDLAMFGRDDTVCRMGLPFSVYRLMHENFCDAGSLIHRRVFDSGVWYDEAMRRGYEDWDFYIQATGRGFKGHPIPGTGFLYREHGHSMLADTKSVHERVYDSIREKHRERFQPAELTSLEHSEVPRFALVATDEGTVRYATNPTDERSPRSTVAEFIDRAASWITDAKPKSTYVPPVIIFSGSDVIDALAHMRLLPGVLFLLQTKLGVTANASLGLRLAEDPFSLEMRIGPAEGRLVASAMSLLTLKQAVRFRGPRLAEHLIEMRAGEAARLTLVTGRAHFRGGHHRLASVLARKEGAGLEPAIEGIMADIAAKVDGGALVTTGEPARSPASHSFFAVQKHIGRGETTFPYTPPADRQEGSIDVVFATAWIRLGGVDQIVLALAGELSRLDPALRIHLALTEAGDVEADPTSLAAFETINFLPPGLPGRKRALLDVLSASDVVVNAHSTTGYRVLPEVKARTRAKVISCLQVIDFDAQGNPGGYPLLAAREYENLIDHFVVPSKQLRRSLVNFGVPRDKIHIIGNAPVVTPPSREGAMAIAREKSRRRYSVASPIRLLYCGRFDHQKGFDRIRGIASSLGEAGVPFDLTVIGRNVLSKSEGSVAIPGARFLPPTVDRQTLALRYAEADVLLLPSRWEGLPLAALEAMAFGSIVIATDVGALSEAIESGSNGFLLDPTMSDADISTRVVRMVADIVAEPHRYERIRLEACAAASATSWRSSARQLASLIRLVKQPIPLGGE
jgi:glycosyltransferase involved in cell wall biosynthesis